MSFKRTIFASYINQIYSILTGIIILPLYLKYMGVEAYGLIAFYIMLQSWFLIFDLGLSPSIARETARFSGGASTALYYRNLLKTLQIIFLFIILLMATLLSAPILQLYSIGNGLLAFTAFPYYLQYAHCKMQLHLIGNIVFICILTPTIIVTTMHYGMKGAAWTWLVANIFWLILWIPIIHHKFARGLHMRWLLDLVKSFSLPFFTVLFLAIICPSFTQRFYLGAELIGISILVFSVAGVNNYNGSKNLNYQFIGNKNL